MGFMLIVLGLTHDVSDWELKQRVSDTKRHLVKYEFYLLPTKFTII